MRSRDDTKEAMAEFGEADIRNEVWISCGQAAGTYKPGVTDDAAHRTPKPTDTCGSRAVVSHTSPRTVIAPR